MRLPGDDTDDLTGVPARLGEHMPARVYRTLYENVGRPYRLDLDHLLAHPRIIARKEDLPLFSLVETDGEGCKRSHIRAVHALVYDVDDVETWDALTTTLGAVGESAWVYTTASSSADEIRVRIIVPLSRPATSAEALAVSAVFVDELAEHGIVCDPRALDADTRRSYVPGHLQGAPYQWARVDGEMFDRDGWLNVARALEAQRAAEQRARDARRAALARTRPRSSGTYAEAALRSACAAVASVGDGGRNATLNREAYSIARLILDGSLDASRVWSDLATAAREAGLTTSEIKKTLASAFGARSA